MKQTFGEFLKSLREDVGYSITDLASKAEISRPFLSLIESNSRKPTPKTLKKLSLVLPNISYSGLLDAAGYDDISEGEKMREIYEDFGEDVDISVLYQRSNALEAIKDIEAYLKQDSPIFKNEPLDLSYKGRELSPADRERVLKMLEALFPEE